LARRSPWPPTARKPSRSRTTPDVRDDGVGHGVVEVLEQEAGDEGKADQSRNLSR
jgi:hypothetical protein